MPYLAPGLLFLELDPQDFRNASACLHGWTTGLRAAQQLGLDAIRIGQPKNPDATVHT